MFLHGPIFCAKVSYYSAPVCGVLRSVCLSVWLSVCPRAYLWNHWTDLHDIFVRIPWPWLGPPGSSAIRYVLLVLWMTSRLAVVGWPTTTSGIATLGQSLMTTNASFCVFPLCYCLVISTSPIDCLERLVSEMTCNVSSETLTLWTLYSLILCHPLPWPLVCCKLLSIIRSLCADQFWCRSGYISLTTARQFTGLSGLCALKFWPGPLGLKGLNPIQSLTDSEARPCMSCVVEVVLWVEDWL